VLQLDLDWRSPLNGAVNADHHSARRNVPDQAQFLAVRDQQRSDAEERQVAFAIAPLGRRGRRIRQRIGGGFNGLFFHGPTLCRRLVLLDAKSAPDSWAVPCLKL
jgi:hypothetical protein